jgi:predicted SAM-dependent methyltransferase
LPEFRHPITLFDHFEIAMVRGRQDFPLTLPIPDGQYLQLGSGYKQINGWLNWDFADWDTDSGKPMPLDDESLDGIVCYHSMDHFAEPIWVLAECQRVLRPNGWFVCVVPHYASELWNSDLTHKNRFATDTWRNIFSERQYRHQGVVQGHVDWQFRIVFNMILAITERNTVLVTQLVKDGDSGE